MASGIVEMSCKECVTKITGMTRQNISAMRVWNIIQSLDEKVFEKKTGCKRPQNRPDMW